MKHSTGRRAVRRHPRARSRFVQLRPRSSSASLVSTPSTPPARVAVELAIRESYGRLIAFLSARTRDLAAAEDALGDAVVAALTTWTAEGVPRVPEAWLLTVARRQL